MKKIILIFCMLGMFISLSANALSYDVPVSVTLNEKYIQFENQPVLINKTTYLPVRFFCEALSADVNWEEKTQTVTVSFGNDEIVFKIGSSAAYVNSKPQKINGSALLIGGHTYLPLRFIAEALGGSVEWRNNYYTADITMENSFLSEDVLTGRAYSDDEIYWLAKIISCESEDEPLKGKVAVGNVVLNRVESDEYPDTIYSVIFDKNYGYQFQPVENGAIFNEPVQDAYLAAKLCLEGYNVVGDCMYFLNPDKATSFWITQNKNYYTSIGNHDFYY